MITVGAISDDLTSALESAGAFAGRGMSSCVALGIDSIAKLQSVQCVAVDTDTRALAERAARDRMADAMRAIGARGILIKTMDSTLRGHLLLEIQTALAVSKRYVAIVAPAFPSEGRTTVGGRQFVDGVPVAETAFQRDPVWPISQSDICEILRQGTLDLVQSVQDPANANLTLRIEESIVAQQRTAFVIDAVTQAQLDDLCQLVERPEQVLWVGSPGLLIALANRLGASTQQKAAVSIPRASGPIIVGVGSVNPASREQLSMLQSRRSLPVAAIDPDLALEDPQHAAMEAIASLCNSALSSPILSVTTRLPTKLQGNHLPAEPSSFRQERGTDPVIQAIGIAVVHLSERLNSSHYVLTGGATALEVSRQLGAHGFTVTGMMEPGIPVATLAGATGTVIAKAGGFGDPELLIRACDYMQQTVQNRRDLD
ncbi:four-carbon acid sugar kinase family protein [Candidatus Bipolaricaulota bacterium]